MRPKRQLIPVILLCVLVFLWIMVNSHIPDLYYDSTRQAMIQEAQASYNAEFEAEYKKMLDSYAVAYEDYTNDLQQYKIDSADYEEHLIDFSAEVEQYKASYAADLEQYNTDIEAYNKAVADRETAYQNAYAAAEKAIKQQGVTFKVSASSSLNYYNHVGNDWTYSRKVNGNPVTSGFTVTIKLGNYITVSSRAEEDDSIPDIGATSENYKPTQADFDNGFTITQKVTVRENRGRYTGNTAGFTFTYTFKPEPVKVTVDTTTLPVVPKKPTKPVYAPPKDTVLAPVEPEEPAVPSERDISLNEPDYTAIVPTKQEILAYSSSPSVLLVIISVAAAVAAFLLFRWFLLERKAEKVAALEAEVSALHDDFYTPIPSNCSHQQFPIQDFSSEEEKRLNYRFSAFLALLDQLENATTKYNALINKRQHKYLQYDESARSELEEQISIAAIEVSQHQNSLLNRKNPLYHLPSFGSADPIEKQIPYCNSAFKKTTTNHELQRFFESSNVSYFNYDGKYPIVFTNCYIIKYHETSHFLEIIPFDRLSVVYKEQTQVTWRSPNRATTDVLHVSWQHMTKNGLPDRRYSHNPVTYTIFDGIVSLVLDGATYNMHFSNKKKAVDVRNKLEDYRASRLSTKDYIAFLLNIPCFDQLEQSNIKD